jgi:heme oxygenase
MNLREATATKHKIAEQMLFNQRMLNSELSKDEYIIYLIQQYFIFDVIEKRNFDLLHQPTNSYRRSMIEKDLNELIAELFPFRYTFETVGKVLSLSSTKEYVKYLNSVNDNDMWAHIYLNYCALYYGGQIIKTKVFGSGNMYNFSEQEDLIKYIRTIQKDSWAEEANKGFDHIIGIFDELQKKVTTLINL